MNRNHFLKSWGMLLACACGTSLLNGCKAITGNSDTPLLSEKNYKIRHGSIFIDLSLVPDLEQDGGAIKLNLPANDLKMIVARTGRETFTALQDQCSHGGREIEYRHEESVFRCVSFGHSKYNVHGQVVEGPAKSNLGKFTTDLAGYMLEIKLF